MLRTCLLASCPPHRSNLQLGHGEPLGSAPNPQLGCELLSLFPILAVAQEQYFYCIVKAEMDVNSVCHPSGDKMWNQFLHTAVAYTERKE